MIAALLTRLPWLRLIGAGLIAAAVTLFVLVVADWRRLQTVERRALACEAAVTNGEPTVLNCPQAISDAATRGQRYLACDAALAGSRATSVAGPDAYTVQAACSAAVKRRDAQATALSAELSDVRGQLDAARAATTAAISRADSRAATATRKDRNAAAAINAAPRTADGRIACDDRCLRALVGN